MKIKKETIVAGNTILRSFKAAPSIRVKGERRQPKMNPTSEAVKKINYKNAVKKLTAILNHNFVDGGWHLTLTYSAEPSKQEAKKNLQRFLRNIRTYCKKHEIRWQSVSVTEYENHRVHHHVVCSAIDPKIINHYWKGGWTNLKALDDSGNYYKLAEYLVKETEKTFRQPDAISRRRYNCSRNIEVPEPKVEMVSERQIYQDPVPEDGYDIDWDTVKRYEHTILGIDCLEFIMVSRTAKPPVKKWKRGKTGKYEKTYGKNYIAQQITMEFEDE